MAALVSFLSYFPGFQKLLNKCMSFTLHRTPTFLSGSNSTPGKGEGVSKEVGIAQSPSAGKAL